MIPFTLDEQQGHGSLPVSLLCISPSRQRTLDAGSGLSQPRQPGGRKLSESDKIPTTGRPAEAERGNRVVGSCLPCAQKRRASVGSQTASTPATDQQKRSEAARWSEVGNASGRLSQRGSRTASDHRATSRSGARQPSGRKLSALRTEAQGKRRKPDRFQPPSNQQKRSAAARVVGSGKCLREAFTAWKPDRFRASDRPAEAERGCSLVGSGKCLRETFSAWKPDRFRLLIDQQKRSAVARWSEAKPTSPGSW